jgi:hypothetical protein
MRLYPPVALIPLASLLLLLSCGEPNPNARGNNVPVQNPPVETSPGPKTGTGGETQANPPPENKSTDGGSGQQKSGQ